MKTLFPSSFNWLVFILVGLLVRLLFINMSWWAYSAVMISIYQFVLLFDSIGYILPTRHLLGAFMCVQFFIGPTLIYNGLEKYQYFMYWMRIPEAEYFQYVLPAVTLFIIALHLNAGNYKGEVINRRGIQDFIKYNPTMPYIFIVVGFFSSVVSGFFGSGLAFVFYLLGSFKYIGLFLLLLGTKSIKPIALVLVIGSIISSSLSSGMFHDLLTWLIFTAAIFGIKYKFDFKIKMIGLGVFLLMVIVIQGLKGSYRAEIGQSGGDEGNAETFSKVYEQQREEGGIFSFKALASNVTRINQGFIITNIMKTVPDIEPYANGSEMYQILEAAVMPRIFAPNKLKAGDRSIFVKYSHLPLAVGTSMGLSSVGDAYVNWGVIGGIIFMFILGIFYSEIINAFHRYSFTYPVLILFVPLVFYYPIRPDCELQTILNHVFKSCFLIFVMVQVFRYQFMGNRFVRKSKLAAN